MAILQSFVITRNIFKNSSTELSLTTSSWISKIILTKREIFLLWIGSFLSHKSDPHDIIKNSVSDHR